MNATQAGRTREDAEGRLSIGALARATGIPVETIRTWERRYAFPQPFRKPSGHRVYPLAAVSRLRRIADAIALGHRPAEVVPLSEASLETLLASVSTRPPSDLPARGIPAVPAGTPEEVRGLMAAVAAFDGPALQGALERQWAVQGPLGFLASTATPFLEAIGTAWREETIGIRHEHFASARLGDFLRAARRPYEERARGPRAALLTLPDEQHEIGLLMAALVFAYSGWRVLYLGPNTPPEQAASLARDAALGVVAVSISAAYPAAEATAGVRTLRRLLPRGVPLVVGGQGAPDLELRQLERMGDLGQLVEWAAARGREAA